MLTIKPARLQCDVKREIGHDSSYHHLNCNDSDNNHGFCCKRCTCTWDWRPLLGLPRIPCRDPCRPDHTGRPAGNPGSWSPYSAERCKPLRTAWSTAHRYRSWESTLGLRTFPCASASRIQTSSLHLLTAAIFPLHRRSIAWISLQIRTETPQQPPWIPQSFYKIKHMYTNTDNMHHLSLPHTAVS